MVRSFIATLAVAGVAAWVFSPSATGAPEALPSLPEPPRAAPSTPSPDLLYPEAQVLERGNAAMRPAEAMGALPTRSTPRLGDAPPEWVMATPPRHTQNEKGTAARGINPCLSPEPGFGNYSPWDRSPSLGQMIMPHDLQLTAGDEFALVIHFHGHEPARKEWVQAVDGAVLVGIDLGSNSGPYLRKFADTQQFTQLLDSVEQAVSERLGRTVHVGKLGLSSWSAGYGAIERALRSELEEQVDAVILLDGLHTGHANEPRAAVTLEPFVEYARRAARGEVMMYVSHSSIVPPTYASTTETANYLTWQLGGRPSAAQSRRDDPMGLELVRQFTDGNFHVRGFSGNGKLDHCAHLGLYRRVLRERLAPRWGLPLAERQ